MCARVRLRVSVCPCVYGCARVWGYLLAKLAELAFKNSTPFLERLDLTQLELQALRVDTCTNKKRYAHHMQWSPFRVWGLV